jgi:hypothetical protein
MADEVGALLRWVLGIALAIMIWGVFLSGLGAVILDAADRYGSTPTQAPTVTIAAEDCVNTTPQGDGFRFDDCAALDTSRIDDLDPTTAPHVDRADGRVMVPQDRNGDGQISGDLELGS